MTTSRSSTFFIDLEPKPAPRPRYVCRGKFAQPYNDKGYTDWKDEAVKIVRNLSPLPNSETWNAPVTVLIEFRSTKPRTSKLAYPSPDVDNLAKAVLDAITQSKVWWGDDKQVVDLRVTKRWADPGEAAGIQVTLNFETA